MKELMYVNMCVCICIHVCTCVYTYVYIYIYVCVYMYLYKANMVLMLLLYGKLAVHRGAQGFRSSGVRQHKGVVEIL